MLASKRHFKLISALAIALLLFPGTATAQDTQDTSAEGAPELDGALKEQIDHEVAQKRREVLEEAVAAIGQSNEALAALEEGRSDDALEALAKVTGKLELVVARHPDLALAPMDVGFTMHDLLATPESVEERIDEAKSLLDRGEVQEARALLADLGSEIVVRVTNIPLATYPEAIKKIAPLIDEGEIDEARSALQTALNTLVVTEHVIALPIVRAQLILDEADTLLAADERSDEDRARLAELVEAARAQFEMASVLGYGGKDDLEELRTEWERIAEEVDGDSIEEGFLASIQTRLAELRDRLFG